MKTGQVWLVRHGEVYNPSAVVYGKLPGFPLSERGARQARSLGLRLASTGVAAVYSSPLERARQTAQILTETARLPDPVILEDLTEWELGSRWSGHTWDWIKQNRPKEWEAYRSHPASIRFIDETLEVLAQRMRRALRHALQETPDFPQRAVCIVSHADPLKVLLLSLMGEDLNSIHSVELDVGSGILVEVKVGPSADPSSVSGTKILDQATGD
ncbi:MAG: hypothetical protein C4318_02730 [Acidimicrobiia bacterium]